MSTYTVKNGKLYNDRNEIAVLITGKYGSGWSTQERTREMQNKRLFSPALATALLTGSIAAGKRVLRKFYAQEYPKADPESLQYSVDSMWDSLCVEWVPAGSMIKIEDYDGKEFLSYVDSENVHYIG